MQCKKCGKLTSSKIEYCKDCILEIGYIINSNIYSSKEYIKKFYSTNTSTLTKIDIYELLKENMKQLNDIKADYYEIVLRCKDRLPFIELANSKLIEMKNILNIEIRNRMERKEKTIELVSYIQKKELDS